MNEMDVATTAINQWTARGASAQAGRRQVKRVRIEFQEGLHWWTSKNVYHKVWDEITRLLSDVNGLAVEVSNKWLYFIINWTCDYLFMLRIK